MIKLDTVGSKCQNFRTTQLRMRQIDVAEKIGCSRENIAAFEQGRNYNMHILLWYMSQGLSIDELRGE